MTTSRTTRTKAGDRFIDTASYLSVAVIKAALADGVTGFMKYSRYDNTDRGKYWTKPEWTAVLELGGVVMSNWEIQSGRAIQGYDTGCLDGARHGAWLQSIGYPDDVSAPVSVDMNTFAANFYAVHGFCRGHFEHYGDRRRNAGYLDTDGGRALADLDLDIWIPGAFSWSPELYALSARLKAQGMSEHERQMNVVGLASGNPQAIAIQMPSTAAYGIRVDMNYVLKPFNVWCAEYTVIPPKPVDPIEVVTPKPRPAQPAGDTDMILIRNTATGWCASFCAGYAVGVSDKTYNASPLPKMDVEQGEWDELIAISDAKKAADRALGVR